MSETKHSKGTLKNTGKTFEEWMCEHKKRNKMPSYYDDEIEWFSDDLSDIAIEFKGIVYEIHKEDVDPYDDISILTKNDTGFDFEFKYYDGGTCFSEMLSDELAKLI